MTVTPAKTVFLVDGYGYTGTLRLAKITQQCLATGGQFVQVSYANNNPNNLAGITAGVNTFDALINSGLYTFPAIAVGISMGTQLLYKWIRDKSPTSAITPSQLSFVLLANPENFYTGVYMTTNAFGVQYGGLGIPNTCPYTVLNFIRQYDGVSDYPQKIANPNYQLALNNAYLGMAVCHLNYLYVGLNDALNFSYVTGPTSNLTYTWSQTYPLPVSGGFQDVLAFLNVQAAPSVAGAAQTSDEKNRPLVEACYNRPVFIPAPLYTPASPRGRSIDKTAVNAPPLRTHHRIIGGHRRGL